LNSRAGNVSTGAAVLRTTSSAPVKDFAYDNGYYPPVATRETLITSDFKRPGGTEIASTY